MHRLRSGVGETRFRGRTLGGHAPHLAAAVGQSVTPENRPANAGILAVEFFARAAPDGYNLLTYGTAAMMYNKLIYPNIKYDAARDFAPVTQLTTAPLALYIKAAVPGQTLGEFIALARNPESKLNYGASGHGHPFHLTMELFKERTGAPLLFVLYKDGAPVIKGLIVGNLQTMFYTASNQMPGLIKAGKIRVLATAGEKRLAEYPDVPTAEEAGVRNFVVASSFALYAPGGTPRDIVAGLNREIVRLSTQPEVIKARNGHQRPEPPGFGKHARGTPCAPEARVRAVDVGHQEVGHKGGVVAPKERRFLGSGVIPILSRQLLFRNIELPHQHACLLTILLHEVGEFLRRPGQ